MNDLISRQAAIKALRDKVFHNLSDEFYGTMQVLDELPPVNAEPVRHGKWSEQAIRTTSQGVDEIGYYCLECGYFESYTAKYCAGCGAKMDGGEKND